MAQEAFEQLTNEWVALSDKITVDEEANYYIQNRGADILLAQEAGEAPTADNVNGTLIKPYEQAKYKANGGDLYLRAYNSNCSVNITSDKTQTSSLWFDMTNDLTIGEPAEGETTTPLYKVVDDYTVTLHYGESLSQPLVTSTVVKDGESVGTVTTWLALVDENEHEVAKFNFDDLVCDLKSENSFIYQTTDDPTVGYAGSLSVETDAETEKAVFVEDSPITYNGEELSTYLEPRIMVKCEA